MTGTIDRAVAHRYAEAFVNALEKAHAKETPPGIEPGLEELELVAQTYAHSKEFQRFLGSPEVATEEKSQLLHRLWSGHVGAEGMGLLDLLIRWDRINHLPVIAEEADGVAQGRQGVLQGHVITARPISSGEVETLAKAVGSRVGKKVLLERVVDPKLIGGVRVVIGTLVIDASIQARLHEIRQQLMEVKVNQ